MSIDYYLVSKEKKIQMPLFTMGFGGCQMVDKRWVFDFILATGNDMKLVHEQSDERPDSDEEGWTFINAWHEYKEKKDQP